MEKVTETISQHYPHGLKKTPLKSGTTTLSETPKPPSTQQGYEDYWVVECNKDTFELNEKQADLLKKATTEGSRGLVWFDKFAISIPHVSSAKKHRRWNDTSKAYD